MENGIIKPVRLQLGDRVGIAAPASPFDADSFASGVAVLERLGFRVVVPDAVRERSGYLAGDDRQRAAAFAALMRDADIRAVFCARGGYGCLRMLPFLDPAVFRADPKPVVGFSDVTALHAAAGSLGGLVTFHGPVVTSLGEASDADLAGLTDALTAGRPVVIAAESGRTLRGGVATGLVRGGNLTTLCHMTATPFAPDLAGSILFLEDRGEAPYRIDRMLIQMRLAGLFDNLAGLVLGGFDNCGPADAVDRVVADIFSDLEIPVLAGFPAGHGAHNRTFPLGQEATLDATEKMLRYHEAATRTPDA